MHAVTSAIQSLARAFCMGCLVLAITGSVSAQDDFFKPSIEAAPPKKHKEGESQIFSFGRFEGEFATLCTELESDGRRDRLVKIAEAGVVREKECITCRSFWKMFVSACGRLGPRPTPAPKPTKKSSKQMPVQETPTPDVSSESQAPDGKATEEGADGGPVLHETPVSATPTRAPRQERYPSVALINEASRLSTAVYVLDSGDGQVAKMFRYFAKTVRETPDMSSPEREYYDIFLTYLLAAWDGRVDSTKLPTPTPSAALRDFFE